MTHHPLVPTVHPRPEELVFSDEVPSTDLYWSYQVAPIISYLVGIMTHAVIVHSIGVPFRWHVLSTTERQIALSCIWENLRQQAEFLKRSSEARARQREECRQHEERLCRIKEVETEEIHHQEQRLEVQNREEPRRQEHRLSLQRHSSTHA